MRIHPVTALLLGATAPAQVPALSELVVPPAYAAVDAPSRIHFPGASQDVRQQILVGASQLAPLQGMAISSLSFRRTADAGLEAYAAAQANVSVTLSQLSDAPFVAKPAYAANLGSNPLRVFQGAIALPASPGVAGPQVPWSAANVVQVPFQFPFVYTGGTLCIDIVGTRVTGQVAPWWMVDAAFEPLAATTVDIGPGCGPHSNAQGQWSFVDTDSAVVGATLQMSALGDVGNFVVGVIGVPGVALPLQPFGLGQAGCNVYLSLAAGDLLLINSPTTFEPDPVVALQHRGGMAHWSFLLPNWPSLAGLTFATQWLDLVALHSSNAVAWTLCMAPASLDMAMVDGAAADVEGNVTVHRAPVVRFEYHRP